ncbi:MAG: hypothetical protein J0M18_18475, partial [Ignavibacteria bacterium]|nr:hypothetical protein [Ignavibacteria bacterium]
MKKSFLTRGFLFIFCVVVLTCLVYLFAVEAQAQNTNFVYSSSDTAFSYKFNSGIDLTKTIPGFVSEYGKATPRSIRLRNTSTDTLYLAFQTKSGAPDTSSTGVIKVAPGRVWKWGEIPSNKIYWKGRTTGSRIFYEVFWAPGSDMPGTEESGLSPEEANTFTAPQTFEDSTTMREVMMLGTAIQRPVMYFKYEDAAQPQTGFVGQVGVGEMNIGLNLDYQAGLHNYFDSTKPQMYQTFNPTEGQVLQWIPPGYPNVTSQPDAWNLSGNTYLYQFDTSGNAKFKGGIESILQTKGKPNIEASRIN